MWLGKEGCGMGRFGGTCHVVHCVGLVLMDGLEVIESCLGPGEVRCGWFGHEAELGVDVSQLLGVCQDVPVMLVIMMMISFWVVYR